MDIGHPLPSLQTKRLENRNRQHGENAADDSGGYRFLLNLAHTAGKSTRFRPLPQNICHIFTDYPTLPSIRHKTLQNIPETCGNGLMAGTLQFKE